jgi:hypothetical protein
MGNKSCERIRTKKADTEIKWTESKEKGGMGNYKMGCEGGMGRIYLLFTKGHQKAC